MKKPELILVFQLEKGVLDENLSDAFPNHSALFLSVLIQVNKRAYMDYIKSDLFYFRVI